MANSGRYLTARLLAETAGGRPGYQCRTGLQRVGLTAPPCLRRVRGLEEDECDPRLTHRRL